MLFLEGYRNKLDARRNVNQGKCFSFFLRAYGFELLCTRNSMEEMAEILQKVKNGRFLREK